MAHHCGNLLSPSSLLAFTHTLFLLYLSSLFHQAAQLTHVLDGRLKELAEDAKREKALKDVAEVTAKEKTKAATTAEKKAAASEKATASAEKKSLELGFVFIFILLFNFFW